MCLYKNPGERCEIIFEYLVNTIYTKTLGKVVKSGSKAS